ncbi:uncharacterized protein LOC110733738 [Chenopodium quinoa]|uniref:uncharacterized protein LOC110733738 n=1 Tax=Chenopodium quinoa TaxID=63459 RepID=UPI000B774013|nr:uncharacterized protein LOC110733738 [Chenopodium quinoa]
MDSRYQKCSGLQDEEDRLSSLPTSILIVILSLLPIKFTVITGVLSKSWCRLWTFITAFRFNESTNKAFNASSIINHVLPQLLSPKIKTSVLFIDDHPYQVSDYDYPHSLYNRYTSQETYLTTLGTDIASWIQFFCKCRLLRLSGNFDEDFDKRGGGRDIHVVVSSSKLKSLCIHTRNVRGKIGTIHVDIDAPNLKVFEASHVSHSEFRALELLIVEVSASDADCQGVGYGVKIFNIYITLRMLLYTSLSRHIQGVLQRVVNEELPYMDFHDSEVEESSSELEE